MLVIFSGCSGVGKNTVINKLISENDSYGIMPTYTTRDRRPGEKDGVHYYFITKDEFRQKLAEDDFLENAEYCGEMYGTPKSLVYEQIEKGKNVILEIEVAGAMQVKEKCPEAVLIMLLPPSFKAQEARLRGRGTDPEDKILKRLEQTKSEVPLVTKYDYVIYNYDNMAKEAAEDIRAIVRSEKRSTSRNKNVDTAYFED